MNRILSLLLLLTMCTSTITASISPLSLESRVQEGKQVIMGEVVNVISYWDAEYKNIYTLHEIRVDGYWKGQSADTYIGIVDLGGQVGLDMQETHPSVELSMQTYGLFILGEELPSKLQLNGYSHEGREIKQVFTTASVQGAITYNKGRWMDPARTGAAISSINLFSAMQNLTSQLFKSPSGSTLNPYEVLPVNGNQTSNKTLAVTTLQDGTMATTTTFNAGVSNNAPMEMIINGNGFGSVAGTIEFPNADAGGGTNTFVFPTTVTGSQSRQGAPSDIISWTNNQIRIRVPRSAGTGTMEVFNSSNVSQGTASITIDWAILPVYSNFFNFATRTSQFARFTDVNGNNGYTFQMSTNGSADFFNNALAKEALRKAMNTWRCGTNINWDLDLSAGTTAVYTNDGASVVLFDNSLPSGVLGRATSRFTANTTGACDMHDTYWRVTEVDLQFQVVPFTGFTWNYNTTGTTSSQFSFETVALHELGHGHGLGHVVDNTKVMHYTSSNGTQITALAPSDIAAGNYKVDNSLGPNCITSPAPMVELINPCSNPLPLELLSLQAYAHDAHNVVRWSTIIENTILEYEIEHSIDGVNFGYIGKLEAQHHGQENDYEFIHTNPINGLNYYRIKEVDVATNYDYSKVVSVNRALQNYYSIFPNPATDQINIELSGISTDQNSFAYTLTDIKGRVWLKYAKKVTSQRASLVESIEALPAGVYFIKLQINGNEWNEKIVKF